MKRLTKSHWRNLDPWECCGQDDYCERGCHAVGGCNNGCIVPKLYARLAAYEDTGLEPEKVKQLKSESLSALDMAKLYSALKELELYKGLGDFERLRELAEADEDGRIPIILPREPEPPLSDKEKQEADAFEWLRKRFEERK